MAKSVERVETVIGTFRLEVDIRHMPESARTAVEAVEAIGCEIGQIVKSLILETDTGKLALLLFSGKHTVDLKKFAVDWGILLRRANPNQVRSETGFAKGALPRLATSKQLTHGWIFHFSTMNTSGQQQVRPMMFKI